ncbi:MAG: bifunctional UDP-N-acetylglucosamine diphosphorylase/glucosamine-1-phosphate N-acetyltransferase GlmU [Endomicrobia bacterium]|nr:bifunctional UDP-N-acetylglucosamine diphosphorylase/glucosamine-1-phosphate N-acetyltransferase GlmU [Endomicrobiia bacterium]
MRCNIGCVILAAGEGTRMLSELPKVLFDICGRAMIEYVVDTAGLLDKIGKIYIVVGYKSELVKKHLLSSKLPDKIKNKIVFVHQKKQLGSGHAVKQVQKYVDKNIQHLLILSGDVPLVSVETLNNLIETHLKTKVDCSVLSVLMENPYGYGRIIRDISKKFVAIKEEVDATNIEKSIKEVNSGIYMFKLPNLWYALKKVIPDNKKREYYLTDAVKYIEQKQTVICKNSYEVKGVNNRKELNEIIEIVRNKIIEKLLLNGVSIMLPQTVYIDWNTKIGVDTKIFQGCTIINSEIGKNCVIGPYTILDTASVGNNTSIIFSHITHANIGSFCTVGPFSRMRPKTRVDDNVSIGNFVELKNTTVYKGVKINHLSYIGDTTLDENVNIGAGTITCNYDGIKKHKTFIGKNTFIGSNVNLVAPIKIGNNVVIAAGSTVTENVPSDTLVIARAKEVHKRGHRIVKKIFYGGK